MTAQVTASKGTIFIKGCIFGESSLGLFSASSALRSYVRLQNVLAVYDSMV